MRDLDYLYTTPSHQCPTGVTMPLHRREALLRLADASDLVIIEDDFEGEKSFSGDPNAALKSLDRNDRVIYIGSLSKSMAPGLRIGYIVAAPALIHELRALRRLMIRHPSSFIQRSLSLFISLGYNDAHLKRLAQAQKERGTMVLDALARHARHCVVTPLGGGGSCWVPLPDNVPATELAERAAEGGVLIEPGEVFFHAEQPAGNFIRLGFQSINALTGVGSAPARYWTAFHCSSRRSACSAPGPSLTRMICGSGLLPVLSRRRTGIALDSKSFDSG